MGKGDKKTRRGKIVIGSYGVRRKSQHKHSLNFTEKMNIQQKQIDVKADKQQDVISVDAENISKSEVKAKKTISEKPTVSKKSEVSSKNASNKKTIKKEE
jgi:ribosomal small subunit protein bTHX